MIERQYSAQRPALKVSAVIKPSGIVTVLLEFKYNNSIYKFLTVNCLSVQVTGWDVHTSSKI